MTRLEHRDDSDQVDTLNRQLARRINSILMNDEDGQMPIHDLHLFRREAPSTACPCLYEPEIVLVCQGAKQMQIDGRVYVYDSHHFLITALDLPASTQVLEASTEAPCLGLSLRLDRSIIAEMMSQMSVVPQSEATGRSVSAEYITNRLLEPFCRLVGLMEEPDSIPLLAPLITREIHYRLLTSTVAPLLWSIVSMGSTGNRITQTIHWLKHHYSKPIRIDELASHVQMSPSSLYHHFRQLTGRSPLQYQKWLRLSEARRLMINDRLDAATAAYQVGYESPSHFNRDYKTLFGTPPKQDIKHLHLSRM